MMIKTSTYNNINDNYIEKIYDVAKINDDLVIEFEKLFQEKIQDTQDEKIIIQTSNNYKSYLFDFSNGPICNSDHALFIESKIFQELFVTIEYRNRKININEFKDDLLFIESYIKHELSLNINYLSTFDGYYYKEVKYLPNDKLIDMLSINLIKVDK